MAHHHRRRMIMALHEQADFVPDRQAVRALRASHPAGEKPSFSGTQQGMGNVRVGGFEKAPLAQVRRDMLVDEPIHLGGNPPHWLPAPPSEEQRSMSMLKPRILGRVEKAVDFGLEGRNPMGIAPVRRPGEVNECAPLSCARDLANDDRWNQ